MVVLPGRPRAGVALVPTPKLWLIPRTKGPDAPSHRDIALEQANAGTNQRYVPRTGRRHFCLDKHPNRSAGVEACYEDSAGASFTGGWTARQNSPTLAETLPLAEVGHVHAAAGMHGHVQRLRESQAGPL